MAMLVLDIANPFFVDVARGAERAARDAGLGVMLCNSGQNPIAEAEYLSMFAEQRVRGVLITPSDGNGANIAAFRRYKIPYVMVDRVGPAEESCSVSVDDVTGGELAARHLIHAGHRNIAYISGPVTLPQCRDRRACADPAVAPAGLGPSALPLPEVDKTARGARGARRAPLPGLASQPTGVLCRDDAVAPR